VRTRVTAVLLAVAAWPAAAFAEPTDTPVLARFVDKGETLGAEDFTTAPLPASQTRDALAPSDAAGMEATRRLNPGSPVRRSDLIKPQLVRRGEPVTIALRSGGLSIVTEGRALSGGGLGDLVRVVSDSTKRTLDATVDGSASVRLSTH
jgi:flagellar basal body P-ring formation protein FlgA